MIPNYGDCVVTNEGTGFVILGFSTLGVLLIELDGGRIVKVKDLSFIKVIS